MDRSGGHRRGGHRSSAQLNEAVRTALDQDPAWQHFTRDQRWICPYCLTAVRSPQDGRAALMRAIDRHLHGRCPSYNNGKGQIHSEEELKGRCEYENIANLAVTDRAWQVFDHEGYWYSPTTLQRVDSVRINNRRFDAFTIQRMVDHLMGCPQYHRGARHPAAAVQQARDRDMRIRKLASNINRLLSHRVWRYRNEQGYWVCPYCLEHVSSVQVFDESEWPNATWAMASHLLDECTAFGPHSQVMHRESEVAQAAGVSNPSTTASPVIGGPAEPSQIQLPPMATPVPNADASNSTPRVAKPINRPIDSDEPTITPPRTPVATPIRTPATQPPMRIATPMPEPDPRVATPMPEPARMATPVPDPEIIQAANAAPQEPAHDEPAQDEPSGFFTQTGEQALVGTMFDSLGADEDPAVTPPEAASIIPADEIEEEVPSDRPVPGPVDGPVAGPVDGPTAAAEISDSGDPLAWMEVGDEGPLASEGAGDESRSGVMRAKDMQQKLLQDAPQIPGYQFATRYEAAEDISGDFYEFINLPDGRIGFAQGDVSGHGIQAGLIMSMAKKVLSIYARMGSSPKEVLSAVNDALAEDLGGKMFVTITYAILDPSARTITWARAGHNPTIRYNRHANEMIDIKPGGMVVGMKAGPLFNQACQEEVTQLRSGDLFLVYTDGVTETMNRQGEEYEAERLQELVQSHGDKDAEQLLDRIMDSLRGFRGGNPADDDITLLLLIVD